MIIKAKKEYEGVTILKFGKQLIGYPKFCSHIYYIDGLLIDTGQRKMKKEIYSMVKNFEVKQIYITHFHEDHSGNLKEIQQLFDCPTYASSLCSKIMKAPPKISFAQKMSWGDRPAYHDLIPKDDVVESDKYQFQLIPIPGHAPDMMALYEPKQKWLFSSDLFLNTYIGYYLEDESIVQQMNSIKKALELDFEVLFCSHNPQLKGGRDKLKKKLNYLKTFYSRVCELHDSGYTPMQIFNKMELKEFYFIKILSAGYLSKMNMVNSALRDYEQLKSTQSVLTL